MVRQEIVDSRHVDPGRIVVELESAIKQLSHVFSSSLRPMLGGGRPDQTGIATSIVSSVIRTG